MQCLPSTVLQLTQHDDMPSHMLRTLTTACHRPSQPEGTLMSPPHLVDRPNMASTPQAGFTQSCADRYSFLFECSSELNDFILSDVPDVTSVLSEPVNVSTLSDFNLRCLFEPDPLDEDSQTKIKNVLENSAENCTHFCGISLTSTDNAVPADSCTLSDFNLHTLFDLDTCVNNNNNIHICIAPYGRNFRGAKCICTRICTIQFPTTLLNKILSKRNYRLFQIFGLLTSEVVWCPSWMKSLVSSQLTVLI